MIFWQIFDFLGRTNIYHDPPFFITMFDMPPHFSVLVLLLTVSGASLYLSFSKRSKKGIRKRTMFLHILKRYGGFILISLIFTTFVWNFCTFFRWEEAIQGIGLAAIFCFLLLSFVNSDSVLIIIAMALILTQPFIRESIWTYTQDYPLCVSDLDFTLIGGSLLLNVFVRGFFSVSNLLPFMIFGVILSKRLFSSKKSVKTNYMSKLAIFGIALIGLSFCMHMFGMRIDFYLRTYSSIMLEFGIVITILSLVEFLIRKGANLSPFVDFGKTSLAVYLGHFLFIYKPVEMLNLGKSLPIQLALVFSLVLVLCIYQVIRYWLKRKSM